MIAPTIPLRQSRSGMVGARSVSLVAHQLSFHRHKAERKRNRNFETFAKVPKPDDRYVWVLGETVLTHLEIELPRITTKQNIKKTIATQHKPPCKPC